MSSRQSQARQTLIKKIFFILGWSLLRPVFLFFLKPLIIYDKNFNYRGPYILVANHTSYLDPPTLGCLLPLKWKVYPLHFLTADWVIKIPIIGWLLKNFGAFPAKQGSGFSGITEAPISILKKNGSLVVFPQGYVKPGFDINEGRKGAALFSLMTKKPLLPLALYGTHKTKAWEFFLRRKRLVILVGYPITLKRDPKIELEKQAVRETRTIMSGIAKLFAHAKKISKEN